MSVLTQRHRVAMQRFWERWLNSAITKALDLDHGAAQLDRMFPIRDHNPSGRTPYVTYILIAANIGIFLSYVGSMNDARVINSLWFEWALIPARLTEGSGFYTLITSQFLHGGWLHLAGNMLFLWIFGDNIEDELGHWRYLAYYLSCGILAALSHYILAPYATIPTVGASGAIAGVMGGYLLLFPKAKVDVLIILIVIFRIIPIPAWIMLAVWFGMQFIGGLGSHMEEAGVAYWAHSGGFVAGIGLLVPFWLRRGGTAFWRRTHGHPPHPTARYRLAPSRIPKVTRR